MQNKMIPLVTPTEQEINAIRYEIEQKIGTKVHPKTAALIAMILQVLKENSQYGKVTVRQVYYQLVSRNVIKNSAKSYQNYNHHLTTGRKAGIIPWDAFEDRARTFYKEPSPEYNIRMESGPKSALESWFTYALDPKVCLHYDLSRWEGQPYFVELWVEKDALVLSPAKNGPTPHRDTDPLIGFPRTEPSPE